MVDLDGGRVVMYRYPRGDGYLEVAEVHAPGELIPVGLEIGATRIDALLRATAA